MADRLLIERLRIFREQTRDAMIGHSTVAVAVTFLLYNATGGDRLTLIWGAITFAIAIGRYFLYRQCPIVMPDPATARRWYVIFQVVSVISGGSFGSLPVLFFEPDNFEITAWIVMILCGLAGGAVNTLGSLVPAYRLYAAALLSPVAIVLLTYQRFDLGVLAGLFIFMGAFFDRFARRFQSMLIREVQSRLEKDDITQDLSHQTGLLKSVMRSMPNAIAVVDPEGRFLYFNQRFQDLFELPDSLVLGGLTHDNFVSFRQERGDFEHLTPEAMTRQGEYWDTLRSAHLPFTYERDLSDGRVLRVENHPVKEGGWVRSWVDVSADRDAAADLVTAKEEAEKSRQELQAALDAMPAGVVIHNEDLRFDIWNQTYSEMTGLSQEQIRKARTLEALGEIQRVELEARDDVETLEHYIERRKSMFDPNRTTVTTEHWVGSGIHVEIRINPIPGGGWVCVFLDVSSRIEAAMEIADKSDRLERARDVAEQTRERMRAILHSIPVGVLVFDDNKRVEFWNDKYCELTGFSPSILEARPHFETYSRYIFDAHDRGKDMKFEDFMAYRRRTYESEETYAREFFFDLTEVDVQYLVSPLAGGGRINVMVDITPQKDAQRAALEARDIAEDATRAKSAFLASMSHEIRTPMNGVIGMAEILAQSRLDDDQKAILETVRESGQLLLRIIDDVLDFSKIEAGRLELEETTIDLRILMESVMETVAPAAGSKDMDLGVFIDPSAPGAFLGDPVRLRQVLTNLAGNAVKFTETGSVVIEVSSAPAANDPSQFFLRFSVADTGIGIPADRLGQLFEPFRQAETETTRRFGGTGLGLSICERLVGLMGGELGVESAVGVGSTFWVELTVAPGPVATPSALDKLDLTGDRVAMVGRNDKLDEMIRGLVKGAGLLVQQESVQTVKSARDSVDVIVADGRVGPADMEAIAPGIALDESDPSARGLWIIGTKMPVAQAISLPRPPRREALLRAIAIMLGKASNEELDAAVPSDPLAEVMAIPSTDEALADGRLVLVVEDNATNRMVVKRQLALLGLASETAEDGLIALEMMREKSYGLILTDCHMPNLDGYELARTIRAKEANKNTGKRIPIVALTANAMLGEAERCKAAGMDDYMSKPVTLETMSITLSRWLEAAEPSQAAVTMAQEALEEVPQREEGSPIDLNLLSRVLGTSDPSFISSVLSLFEPSYEDLVKRMEDAIADEDRSRLREASHAAKGAAANACAEGLRAALESLENAATEDDPDWAQISQLYATSKHRADEVMGWIQREG